jgi:hypothetical protein
MQVMDSAHKKEAAESGREVIALDSSAIAAWLECRKKHQLAYIENLQPIGLEKAHFGKGKLIHKMIEYFYTFLQNGATRNEAMKDALQQAMLWTKENDEGTVIDNETWSFISMRFISYCNFWSQESLKVKALEVGFSVPILNTDKSLYVLEGRIDFLAEDERWGLFWMDHKSQARDYEFYAMTPQFLNYTLALECRTGVINYFGLQTSEPKKGFFRRQPFNYSKGILDEWRWELINIFAEIHKARKTGQFRKNRLSCKHGLNFKCQFTHICEQTVPEFEAEIKRTEFTEREPWTPWSEDE